ncbi:MAG: hypothetical protein AAF639_33140 [Chloroflexota bacterium]
MTTKYNFKHCNLILLEDLFHVRQVRDMPLLVDWLHYDIEVSEAEREELLVYQETLIENLWNWNEIELAYGFIAPLLNLVNFSGENRRFFAERPLEGKIGEIILSGKPDGMIASGKRKPAQPYFCLHEYKKEDDSDGDPAGQVLSAMLVAQEINQHEQPVYGCYIKGSVWYFMVLQGLEFSISNLYAATRDDIVDIFRILKALNVIIAQMESQS